MEAGRELDALVVEKVFGWNKPLEMHPDNLPPYSTDIAAAWRVVETLNKYRLSVLIKQTHGGCLVEVEREDGMKWQTVSDTAPHAISLVALKALGIFLGVTA